MSPKTDGRILLHYAFILCDSCKERLEISTKRREGNKFYFVTGRIKEKFVYMNFTEWTVTASGKLLLSQ